MKSHLNELESAKQRTKVENFDNIKELKPIIFNEVNYGEPLIYEKTLNLITGRSGNRITTFLTTLISNVSKKEKIVWIDTESNEAEYDLTIHKIYKQGGNIDNIDFLTFDNVESYELRKKLLKNNIKPLDAKILVIDNIPDISPTSVLDADEANEIIHTLNKLRADFDYTIIGVIRSNETNKKEYARGIIGRKYSRIAATVLYLENDKKDTYKTNVIVKKHRYELAENFSFMVDGKNIPLYGDNKAGNTGGYNPLF